MSPFWAAGRPLRVECDAAGWPLAFDDGESRRAVRRISEAWRVHSNWWDGEIWRDYYEVITTDGFL